jgi:hypothetical protein
MAQEWDDAGPGAAALIESLRSVGYSLPTSIADLIDNSITAHARRVWLQFEWNGADSWVSLRDDGNGMSEAELLKAMRPGSRSPLEDRATEDLGRFGLGLKTASFAHCRRLTVATTKGASISTRRWDLDYVRSTNEWRLLRAAAPGSEPRLAELKAERSGTLVLWEQLDRVVQNASVNDDKAFKRFQLDIERVTQHLGMVFHDYLSDQRLTIFVNGTSAAHRVKPWSPFDPEEHCWKSQAVSRGGMRIRGYVLPHRDHLSEEEFKRAAGPAGWNAQQGFYVYRNDRMLVSGGWLDLGYTNEEPYRLARIRVDIPASVSADADWEIDIKKSRARPPGSARELLRAVADKVRAQAREVFAHRGASTRGPRQQAIEKPWLILEGKDRNRYRINREHRLLAPLKEKAGSILELFLKLVEDTVPVERIWLDATENPATSDTSDPTSVEDDEQRARVLQMVRQLKTALVAQGETPEAARARLSTMDPFHRYPDLLASLD